MEMPNACEIRELTADELDAVTGGVVPVAAVVGAVAIGVGGFVVIGAAGFAIGWWLAS